MFSFLVLTSCTLVTLVSSAPQHAAPPGPECICVPYYLCNSTKDGTIYIHGENIIDIRFSAFKEPPKDCPEKDGVPQVCCKKPEIDDKAPKPETILHELNKVVATESKLSQLYPNLFPPKPFHPVEPVKKPIHPPPTPFQPVPIPLHPAPKPHHPAPVKEVHGEHCAPVVQFNEQGEQYEVYECKGEKHDIQHHTTNKPYIPDYPYIPDKTHTPEEILHPKPVVSKPGYQVTEPAKIEFGSSSQFGPTFGPAQSVPILTHGQEESIQPEHHPESPKPVIPEHYQPAKGHHDNSQPGKRKCGLPLGIGVRVLGGKIDDLPWLVHIYKKDYKKSYPEKTKTCGGSIIMDRLVLTAAHCIASARDGHELLMVRTSRGDQESKVSHAVIHHDYKPESLLYDYALLWLEHPLHIGTEYGTGIICLPPPEPVHHADSCMATGFYGDKIASVEVPMVPNEECEELLRTTRLGTLFHLHKTFVCAGEEGKDTCKGDGGSPLVCTVGEGEDAPITQLGIVAWGIGCGTKVPGVYASTAAARDWIDHEVIEAGLDPSIYHLPQYHHH